MTYRKVTQAQRLFVSLIVLVLVYLGNAFAGWPVDWWVPVWGAFTVDATAMLVGFAFGAGQGRGQLAASEEYGEFVEKHAHNKESK